jgi:hypothetical protein
VAAAPVAATTTAAAAWQHQRWEPGGRQEGRPANVNANMNQGRAGKHEPGLTNAGECKTTAAGALAAVTMTTASVAAAAMAAVAGAAAATVMAATDTNKHRGTNKRPNTAWVVAGVTRPPSLVPLPPYHFYYYLNIFTYFYVHIILYLEDFNEK